MSFIKMLNRCKGGVGKQRVWSMRPCYFISTRMGLYKEQDLAKSTECDMLHRTVKNDIWWQIYNRATISAYFSINVGFMVLKTYRLLLSTRVYKCDVVGSTRKSKCQIIWFLKNISDLYVMSFPVLWFWLHRMTADLTDKGFSNNKQWSTG